MSGIAGYVNNTEKASSALLDSMSESIRHTESDRIDNWNDDFVAISRVHHGVINPEPQPIFNEDKSLFIVMDGEVFDYGEQKLKLIDEGHKFEFGSNDAEYCLHLYEEMGEDAFKQLNGSFSLAICHLGTTHELILINDRFSSRPLFYYLTGKGTLLFGTQLSSILQSSEVPRELNMGSIFEFFTFQKVLGTKTFYKDIKVLPPATILHYQDGNISFTSYWEMRYREEKHPKKYYVDKLAEGLRKSVMRRTQGNYRFGLLLSGGLDSRAVLAASDKKMVCFTVGDFRNREVKIAKKIAEAKGCKHIFLKRSSDHYANLVDKAVEIGDGMYSFVHAHNIGFFDQIQKECDILLHGWPPEVLFRGSNLPRKTLSLLGKKILTSSLCVFLNHSLSGIILKKVKYSLYPKNPNQLFCDFYSSTLDGILLDAIKNILNEANNKTTNLYNKFDYFVLHNFFRYPSSLYVISIRPYMDERTVICDNDLFDLYLEMPPEVRANNMIWNKALKKLNPCTILIPDANTGLLPTTPVFLEWTILKAKSILGKIVPSRKNSLSHPTYTHDSWPNFAELIMHNEKMKKLMGDTIRDSECLDPNIFNTQRIEKMFEEHLNGKSDHSQFLFLLLTFGRWHKKYGPKNSRGV